MRKIIKDNINMYIKENIYLRCKLHRNIILEYKVGIDTC